MPSQRLDASVIEARLRAIYGKPTMYEVVATSATGRKVLVGYTYQKTRDAMFKMVIKNGAHWVAFTDADNFYFAKKKKDGGTMGDWKINWSGRTKRDCINDGETEFVCDLICPLPHIVEQVAGG